MVTTNADVAAELARLDAELPPAAGKPEMNVVGIPHSGTRAAKQYLEGQGYYVRLVHLQWHYHRAEFLAALIAARPCTLVMRDPLLALLSTQARQDDSAARMLGYGVDLFSLDWPADSICVDLRSDLPTVGEINYPAKTLYAARDIAGLHAALPEFDALAAKETALRPKLEALGYTDLLWWS